MKGGSMGIIGEYKYRKWQQFLYSLEKHYSKSLVTFYVKEIIHSKYYEEALTEDLKELKSEYTRLILKNRLSIIAQMIAIVLLTYSFIEYPQNVLNLSVDAYMILFIEIGVYLSLLYKSSPSVVLLEMLGSKIQAHKHVLISTFWDLDGNALYTADEDHPFYGGKQPHWINSSATQ